MLVYMYLNLKEIPGTDLLHLKYSIGVDIEIDNSLR